MELHRFLVGDGKQWEMAAKAQGGSHFSVSLYFFPSRNPFLALALWIWIFQAFAEFGTPWWPAQAVSCGGISPPPSVKFLNCSACLSCSEVWVPGVADGAGAGGMEWRLWLALGNGSSYQPFLFYIFFAMKIFLPLFFHEACWKQLAKNRFAFVYWLLPWSLKVWSLSLGWTNTQRELGNLSLFCKRQMKKHVSSGLCLHVISRGFLEGKWSAVRGSGLKDPNSTSSCVWTACQLVYGGSFQTMLITMYSRTHLLHLSSEQIVCR